VVVDVIGDGDGDGDEEPFTSPSPSTSTIATRRLSKRLPTWSLARPEEQR
jgi:hypothetical protein